jgi:hypothetical protein
MKEIGYEYTNDNHIAQRVTEPPVKKEKAQASPAKKGKAQSSPVEREKTAIETEREA